jgi:hypothetical protein
MIRGAGRSEKGRSAQDLLHDVESENRGVEVDGPSNVGNVENGVIEASDCEPWLG